MGQTFRFDQAPSPGSWAWCSGEPVNKPFVVLCTTCKEPRKWPEECPKWKPPWLSLIAARAHAAAVQLSKLLRMSPAETTHEGWLLKTYAFLSMYWAIKNLNTVPLETLGDWKAKSLGFLVALSCLERYQHKLYSDLRTAFGLVLILRASKHFSHISHIHIQWIHENNILYTQ